MVASTNRFASGFRLRTGEELNDKVIDPLNNTITQVNTDTANIALLTAGTFPRTVNAAVTAGTTQTQAGATQLTGVAANVTVVGTANDGVKLPLAIAGTVYFLTNADAADAMKVYGAGTDTINGVATATGVTQAAGVSAVYFCTTAAPAGKWFRVLSA